MIRARKDPPALYGNPIFNDAQGRYEVNALRIGGVYSPGLCEVRRASITYNWDERKGFGISGAWLVFGGKSLSKFDTLFTIITEEDRLAFDGWAKTRVAPNLYVQPQTNGAFLPALPRPKALGVSHPLLSELGITQIVPIAIHQWEEGKGSAIGKWTKLIEWYEFRAPKPAIGKPDGPVPDTKNAGPVALTAQELELRAKRQDFERRQAVLAKKAGHG